jgi:hypothetical protein
MSWTCSSRSLGEAEVAADAAVLGAVEGRVDQGDEQPVAAQLQLQPQVGAGVDHGRCDGCKPDR